MKQSLIAVLCVIASLLFSGCTASEENYKVARGYVSECEESGIIISLGEFGWRKVRKYWKQVPELRALREEFENADDILGEELMKEEEFQVAHNELLSSNIFGHKSKQAEYDRVKTDTFNRLRSNASFQKIRDRRDEALFICNIETMKYIIDDYESRGKKFPINWIAKTK